MLQLTVGPRGYPKVLQGICGVFTLVWSCSALVAKASDGCNQHCTLACCGHFIWVSHNPNSVYTMLPIELTLSFVQTQEIFHSRTLINGWCKPRVEILPFENQNDEVLVRFMSIQPRTG